MRPRAPHLSAIAFVLALGYARPAHAQPANDTLRAHLDLLVAQKKGLFADEVARRAVDTSYSVRQRAEEVAAADAGVKQALVAYLPRLQGLARYTRFSSIDPTSLGNVIAAPTGTPPGPLPANTAIGSLVNAPVLITPVLDNTTLQATLTVPLLDYVLRIPGMHEAAERTRDAAKSNEDAARLQVAADARIAYYAWARARLQTVVAEQALAQAKEHKAQAEHHLAAGTASSADVARTAALVASAEVFLARARDLEAVLEDQLRTAMHDKKREGYLIGEDLRAPLEPMAISAPEPLYEEAWSARHEIRMLERRFQAEEAQAKIAHAGLLPRIDAFGDVIYANPNTRFFPLRSEFDATWDVGIQLVWAPNDTLFAMAQADQAEARGAAIEAQLGQVRDALRGEVIQSLEAVREADLDARTTGEGLDAAEESYRVRHELYQNERATSVELTDAETDLTQARLNAIGARIDQRVARIRLEHATGRDIASEKR